MNPSNTPHEDLRTRWIDGDLSPKEAALMQRQANEAPEFLRERAAASQLGELLRKHLPAKQEPPSPDFFTSSVMDAINCSPIVRQTRVSQEERRGLPSWLSWMKAAWFAPLASAAAVAIGFLTWNHLTGASAGGGVAQTLTYAPNPAVVANSYYSDEAGATVIDLQNLTPIDASKDIRAFDVASAEPSAPGEPTVYFAASDPTRAVMIRSRDAMDHPKIMAIR